MILTFNEQLNGMLEPTSDRAALRDAINLKPSENGTFLYDAMQTVIKKQFRRIQGRKAVVLFTDGVDNVSILATYESSLRDIEESDILVYPVQYDTFVEETVPQAMSSISTSVVVGDIRLKRTKVYPPGFNAGHYERANNYLRQVAEKSGTRFYHAGSVKKLAEAFALIAQDLRRQYSLGYYPRTVAQPGERRLINVRVNQRGLVVRARDSYTTAAKN
jgi:Ca-activated chloride channel family protein